MDTKKHVTIERMTASHLSGVARLEELCFAAPWTEKGLELLLCENGIGVVAICEGIVVSYVGMVMAHPEGEITNVATHPDYRGCGFARSVLEWLIAYSRKNGFSQLSLEVRESNHAAILLYESLGFSVAGKRPRFYKNPSETALVMLLEL